MELIETGIDDRVEDQIEYQQMVAYLAAHATAEHPWRCVICEELTPLPARFVHLHLATEHGLGSGLLFQEGDSLFLYPPKKPPTKKEVAQ